MNLLSAHEEEEEPHDGVGAGAGLGAGDGLQPHEGDGLGEALACLKKLLATYPTRPPTFTLYHEYPHPLTGLDPSYVALAPLAKVVIAEYDVHGPERTFTPVVA